MSNSQVYYVGSVTSDDHSGIDSKCWLAYPLCPQSLHSKDENEWNQRRHWGHPTIHCYSTSQDQITCLYLCTEHVTRWDKMLKIILYHIWLRHAVFTNTFCEKEICFGCHFEMVNVSFFLCVCVCVLIYGCFKAYRVTDMVQVLCQNSSFIKRSGWTHLSRSPRDFKC